MQFLVPYVVSTLVFLGLDAIMLRAVMKPLFERHLGDVMRDPIDVAPAVGFYLLYVAGLTWLVSMPALRDGSVTAALLNGAILGGVAYGTYEFTNKATLRGWDWSMVATDWAWGIVLTGVTAAAGVWAARALLG